MADDPDLTIDQSSFVYADGVKICKVTADGTLLFHDKNKIRSAERGTNQVEVKPAALASLVEPSPTETNPAPPEVVDKTET